MWLSVLAIFITAVGLASYLVVQFSWAGLKTNILHLTQQVKSEADDEQNLIIHLVAFSKLWFRKQFSLIDQELAKMDSSLIYCGLAAVREDYSEEDLHTVMLWRAKREQRLNEQLLTKLHNFDRQILSFGLIAGLISLLISIGLSETFSAFSLLLPCISAMLFSLILQSFLIAPLIAKLETKIKQQQRVAAISIEGVKLIHQRKTPAFIRELLENMALGEEIRPKPASTTTNPSFIPTRRAS